MVAACSTSADRAPSLVLFVDDDADTRDLYDFCLTTAGFAVEGAADGQEALVKATSLLPSAVVTDITLPLMDGFELCREIKRNPLTAHIPVIGMTGYSGQERQEKAGAAGFDAYLEKPVLPDDLIAEIRGAILAVRATRAQSCELRAASASLCEEVRQLRQESQRAKDRASEVLNWKNRG